MRLPRLASAIPLSIAPRELAAANASLARFLIQAGAVREGDIPEAWADAMEVCERALDAWVKRELGYLHCLQPTFALTAVNDADSYTSTPRTKPVRYRKVRICWAEHRERQWAIGTALEALERLGPELGMMVLDILRRQSRFVYPLFTPDLACDVASYVYWCGEADEEAALDMECGEDEQARAAMREEMLTRQKLTDAFPAWALTHPRNRLSLAAFQRMAEELSHHPARDIARDALTLARLRIKDEYRPDIDGEFIGFGAVLSWHEDDVTVRIYDDLLQLAYQSEFCDLIGELEIDLDTPQSMRIWQREMRIRFKAIRLIDSLIYKLSEGN